MNEKFFYSKSPDKICSLNKMGSKYADAFQHHFGINFVMNPGHVVLKGKTFLSTYLQVYYLCLWRIFLRFQF
jgi:hypothetical protein